MIIMLKNQYVEPTFKPPPQF